MVSIMWYHIPETVVEVCSDDYYYVGHALRTDTLNAGPMDITEQ